MKEQQLSPVELKRAQRVFLLFNLFNVLSFNFLSGNIITLYALRLQAGSFLIGLLASFVPLAQVLPLAGRALVPKFGVTRLMGTFWFVRYFLMVPILFAPIFVGRNTVALILCVIGILGFNAARGIAITGHHPILGAITTDKDRGSFLSKNQIIVHSTAIFTGMVIALLLGEASPLYTYTIIISIGIVSGLIASAVIFKLPEPKETRKATSLKFLSHLWKSLQHRSFRKFIILLFLTFSILFMIRPFLIVFMKKVYNVGDSTVVFFTVIGAVGAIVVALISGLMIDRIGAKPLYFIFSGVITVTLIALITSPVIESGILLWVYAGGIFFLYMMGMTGIHTAANIYFFAIISEEERLNLSIVYFLTTGASGFVGSFAGGAILDWFEQGLNIPYHESFRIYFGLIAVVSVIILILAANLEKLGAYSIRDAITFFFSPRDLRAISLLQRLQKTKSIEEERSVIQALGESQSGISATDLLQRLKSPRLSLRTEALTALYNISPDENVKRMLISEVKNHKTTTAYLAADILGKHRIHEGIKVLRQALHSRDYFLCGKSMVALARLNDRDSINEIVEIIQKTSNPRLIIHAATALEIFQDTGSVPHLIEKLRKKTSPFVRDEIILSIAGILGINEFFYPIYTEFLEKSSFGVSYLMERIQHKSKIQTSSPVSTDHVQTLLNDLTKNKQKFMEAAGTILEERHVQLATEQVSAAFISATKESSFVRLDRFCFLLAALIVWFF